MTQNTKNIIIQLNDVMLLIMASGMILHNITGYPFRSQHLEYFRHSMEQTAAVIKRHPI